MPGHQRAAPWSDPRAARDSSRDERSRDVSAGDRSRDRDRSAGAAAVGGEAGPDPLRISVRRALKDALDKR